MRPPSVHGEPDVRRRPGSRLDSRARGLASDRWTTTRFAYWSRACRDRTPPAARSSSVPRSSPRAPTPRRSWRGSPPMTGNRRLRCPSSPRRACTAHASVTAAEWARRRRGDMCCLLVCCPERSRQTDRRRRRRNGAVADSNQASRDDHSSGLGSDSRSRPRRHIDRRAHVGLRFGIESAAIPVVWRRLPHRDPTALSASGRAGTPRCSEPRCCHLTFGEWGSGRLAPLRRAAVDSCAVRSWPPTWRRLPALGGTSPDCAYHVALSRRRGRKAIGGRWARSVVLA
jgi:hypothetical protein